MDHLSVGIVKGGLHSDATGMDHLSVGTVMEGLRSDATGMDHLSVGTVKEVLLLDATETVLRTDGTGRVLHLTVATAPNAVITVIGMPIKVSSVSLICGPTEAEL